MNAASRDLSHKTQLYVLQERAGTKIYWVVRGKYILGRGDVIQVYISSLIKGWAHSKILVESLLTYLLGSCIFCASPIKIICQFALDSPLLCCHFLFAKPPRSFKHFDSELLKPMQFKAESMELQEPLAHPWLRPKLASTYLFAEQCYNITLDHQFRRNNGRKGRIVNHILKINASRHIEKRHCNCFSLWLSG